MKKLVGMLFAVVMVVSTLCTPAFAASLNLRSEVSPSFYNITGYIGGYEDGSMRPNGTLTRVEMMQIVSNLMHNDPQFNKMVIPGPNGGVVNIFDTYTVDLYWAENAINNVNALNVFTPNYYRGFVGTNPGYVAPMEEIVHNTYIFLGMKDIPMGKHRYDNYSWVNNSKYSNEIKKFMSYGWDEVDPALGMVGVEYKYSIDGFLANVNQILPEMYTAGLSDNPSGSPRLFADNTYGDWDTYAMLRPTAPMTREEMALVLYRLTDKSAPATLASYSDTQNLSQESKTAIAVLSSNGIIKGYPDGSFGPAKTLTRAEAIVMINRFFSDRLVANPNHTFHPWDIKGHWAEAEINRILK